MPKMLKLKIVSGGLYVHKVYKNHDSVVSSYVRTLVPVFGALGDLARWYLNLQEEGAAEVLHFSCSTD